MVAESERVGGARAPINWWLFGSGGWRLLRQRLSQEKLHATKASKEQLCIDWSTSECMYV